MFNMMRNGDAAKAGQSPELFSQSNVAEMRRAEAWFDDRLRASQKGVVSEVVVLTPALAELLLARNDSNRAVRPRAVRIYATDIVAGNWELNGESIKVSRDGFLNDGQHRCSAVIEAGRSIRTIILFGVERKSRLTVDQGAVRTSGNYLQMQGVDNSNVAAAVAGLIWQWETRGRVYSGGEMGPTKAQIQETFERHRDSIDASISAMPRGGKMFGSQSVVAFCHWLIARRASSLATSFIGRLCLGEGLTRRDPIYHCRERLLGPHRLKVQEKVEIIIRTWNASRAGKPATKCSPVLGELPAVEI